MGLREYPLRTVLMTQTTTGYAGTSVLEHLECGHKQICLWYPSYRQAKRRRCVTCGKKDN